MLTNDVASHGLAGARVVLIGGAEPLRSMVSREYREAGASVHVLTRTEHADTRGTHYWRGDMRTGAGVAVALDGADIAVSLARYDRGLEPALRNLAWFAQRSQVGHVLMLMRQVDWVTRSATAALLVERLLSTGNTGILHSSIPHQVLDHRLQRLPGDFVRRASSDVTVNPVDVADIAHMLLTLGTRSFRGVAPDLIGPEVLPLRALLTGRTAGRHAAQSLSQDLAWVRQRLERAVESVQLTHPFVRGSATWSEYRTRR